VPAVDLWTEGEEQFDRLVALGGAYCGCSSSAVWLVQCPTNSANACAFFYQETMTQRFLPFALPEIGEEEIAEVVSALCSGWVTTGPKTKQFESDFVTYLGGGVEAIAINSATAGLHLGLEAMGIGPGDEVITTTHTFTATAEIIRYLGADPVFVDADADTLCIDLNALERAITPRTKAIIPVHFAGRAADMTRLLVLAKQHGLKVMEDAAHALPTTCEGELIGTLASDLTVFSFYANKTMTTGEGGMLVTRNAEIAKRARVMRLHGINRDAFDRFTSNVPGWYYEVIAPGFKYNMTDIAAAIGIHQLKKVGRFQERRHQIAEIYNEAFSGLPIALPPGPATRDIHSWHLYIIQLQDGARVSRDQFIERMFEQGIGCSVHYIPLHLHPYWRETYNLKPEMFPNSQRIYERCVSLPIYSKMTDADVERVVGAVKDALQ
jgi:dTDP-4-amino-4,6-dideoxygalactose transaminase